MSPHQRENPDQYQDRRPPERQRRQGSSPPPTGRGQQGGGQQGPPPEQFGGQQSPQPGGQSRQQRSSAGRQGGHGQGSQHPSGQQPQQRGGQQRQHRSSQQTQQPPQQSQPPMGGSPQGPPQQQAPPSGMMSQGQRSTQQLGTPGNMGGGRMQGPQLQSASISEILQSDVVTVETDTQISEIVERMATEEVGSVIVVDDEEPVGIVTDRSIAMALQESTDLTEWTANDFVSSEIVTGNTEMTVFEVLDQLEDNGIRRLPIVDDEGSLEGIVTLDDIFVLLDAEMEQATSIIESQSPRF